MTVRSADAHVPLPTTPIRHRPIERAPSPFGPRDRRTEITGLVKYKRERDRLAAQREARDVLRRLDQRRDAARVAEAAKRAALREGVDAEAVSAVLLANLERDGRVAALARLGYTVTQISRITGMTRRTVHRHADILGVTLRSAARVPIDERLNIEQVREMRASGMLWREVSKAVGCDRETLRQFVNRHGGA